jgi:hypothetical protein
MTWGWALAVQAKTKKRNTEIGLGVVSDYIRSDKDD